MHRIRVFLNSAASSGQARDWKGNIEKFLFRSELDFVSPQSLTELKVELDRASRQKIDVIISVGGDGTFNTLLQALAHTDTTFLIIPAGTANDLARELGTTGQLRKALECVRRNDMAHIDLISINDRYMATNGGIGIVSDVAKNINSWRKAIPGFTKLMKRLSFQTYAIGLVGHLALAKYRHYHLRLTSAEFSGEIITPLLLVNNQPYIAGSFPVAPTTLNNDGKFNVTFFAHKKWLQFATSILRIRQGLPVDHDAQVVTFETSELKVELLEGEPCTFFGDGEFLTTGKTLHIRSLPLALKVFRQSIPCFKQPEEFVTGGSLT